MTYKIVILSQNTRRNYIVFTTMIECRIRLGGGEREASTSLLPLPKREASTKHFYEYLRK
ncbi:hypothetical protein [Helicobacter didelphidarum]|uniref:hypothetical protein n=1 Tax=Helicobacter didelphidarum TaxID=2040648 RepID=UPI0011C07678|nr:hypothetical protein [Helicobacter didelphidarum]